MTCAQVRRVKSTIIETLPFGIPLPDLDSCSGSSRFPETPLRSQRKYPFPVMSHEGHIPHISVHTVAKLLRGEFKKNFSDVIVVDCRFGFEYEGGHIKGAIHINDASNLKNLFETAPGSAAIVFHCEFSQSRGPAIASLFRSLDRKMNEARYPNVTFPHVFIMYKGYKKFHKRYPDQCTGGYVRMLDNQARKILGHEQAVFKENIEKARIEFGIEATEREEERKYVSIQQISPLVCRRRDSRIGLVSAL